MWDAESVRLSPGTVPLTAIESKATLSAAERMKNIQVIDQALNAAYCIFAATEREFSLIFPGGRDIEFAEDLWKRLGKRAALVDRLWKRPVHKKSARGIHGTLFFGLRSQKEKFYPTRRELDMIGMPPQFLKFRQLESSSARARSSLRQTRRPRGARASGAIRAKTKSRGR